MHQLHTTKYFETSDLRIASLIYATYPEEFVEMDRRGSKCWFLFTNIEQCKEAERAYHRNEAVIPARTYVEAERNLKDLIFASERRSYGR